MAPLVGVLLAAGCDRSEPPPPATGSEPVAGPVGAEERSRIGGEILFLGEREGRNQLRAVTPAGHERLVAADPEADLFPASAAPALAIATSGDEHDHREQMVLLEDEAQRPIGPVSAKIRNPSWAPDGTWLVFESDQASFRDLFRLDLETGEVVRLTESEHGNFEPEVSPDGRHIAFVSSHEGGSELYVMDAGGGEPRRLTDSRGDDWAPRWAPDGATLAFLSDREGVERIFLMQADGTGQKRLTSSSGETHEGELVWAPDGRRLAYVLRGTHGAEVWMASVVTGTSERLSSPGARDSNPTWSPDGGYLVFASRQRGETDLYLIRADGSGRTRLTSAPGADWLPRWSSERPRS